MRQFKRDDKLEEKWFQEMMNKKCKICSLSVMQLHPEYPKVNALKCSICGYTVELKVQHTSVVLSLLAQ